MKKNSLIGCITGMFFYMLTLSASERLELIHADRGEMIKLNSRELRKLEGNVKLRQGEAFLFCDQALFDIQREQVTLLGHVEIYDGKHYLWADTVEYYGKIKLEKARGNVKLAQGNQTLRSRQLEYYQTERKSYAFGGVEIEDLLEKAILTADTIFYNRRTDYGIAKGNPKIIQIDSTLNDSLIITGDTIEAWGERRIAVVTGDVRIRKGDLFAFCEKARFPSQKQEIHLFGSPEMTELNRHVTGDSILVILEDHEFSSGVVFGNAIITSTDSTLEDILKGDKMTMAVVEDSNRVIIVEGQTENKYHVFNETKQLEGVNEINGDRITMKFTGKTLEYIRVESDPGESRGRFVPDGFTTKKDP